MTEPERVAVVTGAARGLGRAIALRLAVGGAAIAALDLDQDGARETVEIAGGGLALAVDVSDSAAVDAAFAAIEEALGPPDVLVNNAGTIGGAHLKRVQPLLERQRSEAAAGQPRTPLDALVRLGDAEWRKLLAVHLDGTFHCTRAAARSMASRERGAIVNMSSICGLEGCAGHPHYSAAKAGVIGFTKSVAKELIAQGIRVNAIAPGHVDTSVRRGALHESQRALAARIPAGRLGEPEEVAATVAFLAGEGAGYFVGAVLSPNGGLLTA